MNELWYEGVETFDSSKNEIFRMRAALMLILICSWFGYRLLGHFKSLVGNRSQLEDSIAESHIVEEVLTLYSRYFEDMDSRVNRSKCVNDEPNHNEASKVSSMFPPQGKPIRGSNLSLTQLEKTQAHQYVLLNCAAVKPFIE